MRYRTLPATDVAVSEVGLGAWTLAGGPWGEADEREAVGLLRAALERGVTLFDAGEGGDGRAEALIARALGSRRDEVVYAIGLGGRAGAWSADSVRAACERALARLRTDRIDVVRLYEPPAHALRADEALGALDDLVREGAVRAIAVSAPYNLLEPSAGERALERARENGLGVIARDPHCSGMLEAKYTAETAFPQHDPRARRPPSWLRDGLRAMEALRFLSEERPHSPGQAALKWALAEPLVAAALPDVYGPGQLEDAVAAPDLPDLDDQDLARIAALRAEGFGAQEAVSAAG